MCVFFWNRACKIVYAHVKSLILQSAKNSLAARYVTTLNIKFLQNEFGKVPWKFVHE